MPGDHGRTLYDVLGVKREATTDEIRHAYRSLVRRHHPDHLGARATDPGARRDAEAKIRELTCAWQILRDPARRADYDRRFAVARHQDAYSPFPSGTEPEPAGGFEEWFAEAEARHRTARVVAMSRTPTKPFNTRLLIGFGVMILIGILLIVGVTGRSGGDRSPAVPTGRCVRIDPGMPATQVPCSAPNDGRVVGQVVVSGKCPAGAVGARLSASDTQVTCLAQTGP